MLITSPGIWIKLDMQEQPIISTMNNGKELCMVLRSCFNGITCNPTVKNTVCLCESHTYKHSPIS